MKTIKVHHTVREVRPNGDHMYDVDSIDGIEPDDFNGTAWDKETQMQVWENDELKSWVVTERFFGTYENNKLQVSRFFNTNAGIEIINMLKEHNLITN